MSNAEQRLIDSLKEHPEGLTKPQIWEMTGIWHSGDVVMKLRRKGFDIEADMVSGKNRYDEKVRYARYKLISEVA